MPKPIELNEGAQTYFVEDEGIYNAYIGGVGSGKTYALVAKALKYGLQKPSTEFFHPPRGIVAAATYPLLRDAVYPVIEELANQTGAANFNKDFKKQSKELTLANGGKMLFRSLDDPDTVVRGPELSYVAIDEGRNIQLYHWKLSVARLRQKGYKRGGFVASTPNGFDWMYQVFHPDSEDHWDGATWYGAPTKENPHLPPEYLAALEASYEGRFYEQEVLGHFVGVVQGSVFPYWDPATCLRADLAYDPDLPLYSFWDFGFGDLGVCVFAQVQWLPKEGQSHMGPKMLVPHLYILDVIDAKEWTTPRWASAYKTMLAESFNGARPRGNYGDPAGKQRQGNTGSSYIDDLASHDVFVEPVQKRPPDWALRLLSNMMAGGRVLVSERARKVSDAFAQYHYKTDGNGNVVGDNPVHDWTSHYVDAVRYGAVALLSHFAREQEEVDETKPYEPQQYGYLFDQLTHKDANRWLGPQKKRGVNFIPPSIGVSRG